MGVNEKIEMSDETNYLVRDHVIYATMVKLVGDLQVRHTIVLIIIFKCLTLFISLFICIYYLKKNIVIPYTFNVGTIYQKHGFKK